MIQDAPQCRGKTGSGNSGGSEPTSCHRPAHHNIGAAIPNQGHESLVVYGHNNSGRRALPHKLGDPQRIRIAADSDHHGRCRTHPSGLQGVYAQRRAHHRAVRPLPHPSGGMAILIDNHDVPDAISLPKQAIYRRLAPATPTGNDDMWLLRGHRLRPYQGRGVGRTAGPTWKNRSHEHLPSRVGINVADQASRRSAPTVTPQGARHRLFGCRC